MNNKKEPTLEPEPRRDEEGEDQFPTDTATLRNDLRAFGVRAAARVATYLAQGNLQDGFWLDQGLVDMSVDVNIRRPFIKFWLNKKGTVIPKELERTLSPEVTREAEREKQQAEGARSKYSVDEDTGVIKVATSGEKALTMDEAKELSKNIKKELTEKRKASQVAYVYDTETGQVRMAKAGEIGGTLEQGKELKRMAEEGKKAEEIESPFIMDELGNWILNPRARVTGVELMAFESIRRSQDRGEPVDPLEALSHAADKMRVYQEALGGGAKQFPEWMTDPTKFIETVRTISGESKGDEGIKTELAELRTTLKEMQEQRHRQELGVLQDEINMLGQRMGNMTGRTEMDILHEIANGVLREAAGARGDVKSYMMSQQALPRPKTLEEKETRKERYRKGLENDRQIEALGKSLFFGEPLPSEREPAAPPKPKTTEVAATTKEEPKEKNEMGHALY